MLSSYPRGRGAFSWPRTRSRGLRIGGGVARSPRFAELLADARKQWSAHESSKRSTRDGESGPAIGEEFSSSRGAQHRPKPPFAGYPRNMDSRSEAEGGYGEPWNDSSLWRSFLGEVGGLASFSKRNETMTHLWRISSLNCVCTLFVIVYNDIESLFVIESWILNFLSFLFFFYH